MAETEDQTQDLLNTSQKAHPTDLAGPAPVEWYTEIKKHGHLQMQENLSLEGGVWDKLTLKPVC